MIVYDQDSVCIFGMHRSGTSAMRLMFTNSPRKYHGEITSYAGFLEHNFAIRLNRPTYFTTFEQALANQTANVQNRINSLSTYQDFQARVKLLEQVNTPIVYKVLVNQLSDITNRSLPHKSQQDIDSAKRLMLSHKIIYCRRSYRDIIISELVRPYALQWLKDHNYNNFPNGMPPGLIKDPVTIKVPYDSNIINTVIARKPRQFALLTHMEDFVISHCEHKIIDYQQNLGEHEWCKPYYNQRESKLDRNPFTYTFDYDVDQVINKIRTQCNHWM